MVRQVYEFTRLFFQDPRFDASHDFDHVLRVTNNAISILQQEQHSRQSCSLPDLDTLTVVLGALLHDVEDKKYFQASAVPVRHVRKALLEVGMSESQAARIQDLVEGVSYSSEVKDPRHVQDVIQAIPELAVVQDADRLDAIGAIGIGRCFAFGGARRTRSLGDSIEHFEDKLLKLEGMMKTQTGKKMAAERSRRIREFMSWWQDEVRSSTS